MSKKNHLKTKEEWFNLEPHRFLENWYKTEYESQSYTGAQSKMQDKMHKSLEKKLPHPFFHRVLEVGANSGEHIKFVMHEFEEYVLTDVRDLQDSIVPLLNSNSKYSFVMADVENLPFADNEFDRVISTCVLHHLQQPERALMELMRVTKKGGQISIFLPSDPGLFFRFAKLIGPLHKAKKSHLYEVKRLVDARDHINHVFALSQLISHVFRNCTIKKSAFPLKWLPLDLSLWNVYQVTKN